MPKLYAPTIGFPQPAATDLNSISFGAEMVDKLFGELKRGELIVLHGSRMCHVISELLCIRSQLPDGLGGLEASAVFIDGGNLFDPYLISETARLMGLEPEETLRNIWVSRAFTSYQLTALLTEKLPEILNRKESKLVVVSDLPALYCDSDIGLFEAKRTFNRVTRFLWDLIKERRLLLVATSLSSKNTRKRGLEHYLLGRADVAAKIEDRNPYVRLTLEKHPSKPTVSVDLFFEEPRGQFLLEDFVEA
jgi:hypothetical protein